MNFEVETKYTYDEYKKFNKTIYENIYHYKRKINFAIIIYAIIIGGFIAFKEYLWALAVFIAAVMLMYLTKRNNDKAIKNAYETNEVMKDAVCRFKFTDDRVEATSPKGVEYLEYDKMYKLIETDTNFYLMFGQNLGFIINKSNCKDNEIEFIRSLKNYEK